MIELPGSSVPAGDKPALYRSLEKQLASLLEDETDLVANAANCAGLLYASLPDVNWVGFYFLRGDDLLVGPFQGKPACVRIALGSGVCGAAAADRTTRVVADVHAFEGHIACDPDSRSEIVVSLVQDGVLLGVLDIDSPLLARFDDDDRAGLERLAAVFLASLAR
jgi:GAF domain-containing protein